MEKLDDYRDYCVNDRDCRDLFTSQLRKTVILTLSDVILSLPRDIWVHIFSFLPKEWKIVRSVCRDFFTIMTNYYEKLSLVYSSYIGRIDRLIYQAAQKNHVRILRSLLEWRESLGYFGREQYPLIIEYAVIYGHFQILLYMDGRDVYYTKGNFNTAIFENRIHMIEHMDKQNRIKHGVSAGDLVSDYSGEYLSDEMRRYLTTHGVRCICDDNDYSSDDNDDSDHYRDALFRNILEIIIKTDTK